MERIKQANKREKKTPKERKCNYCEEPFTPSYSTLQVSCSPFCSMKASAIKERKDFVKKAETEKKTWHLLNDKLSTFEAKLQTEINAIVRLIDYGQPCIATGSFNGKVNAGH